MDNETGSFPHSQFSIAQGLQVDRYGGDSGGVGMTSVMLDGPENTVFSDFILRARPKDDSLDGRPYFIRQFHITLFLYLSVQYDNWFAGNYLLV